MVCFQITLVQKSRISELSEFPGKFVPKWKASQESWEIALFSINSIVQKPSFSELLDFTSREIHPRIKNCAPLRSIFKIPSIFSSKSRSCAEHPKNFEYRSCAEHPQNVVLSSSESTLVRSILKISSSFHQKWCSCAARSIFKIRSIHV